MFKDQSNTCLINYTLQLADNALIIGHRNSEWCGHGPVLEQDIALSNIALDLIGQARYLYQYAAEFINASNNKTATEDTLAYLRHACDFKNCLLVELPNGDWGNTILRQFFFSTYQYYLYQQLQNSTDKQLAAIAAKALKEVTYHVRWSSEWVIRLGDGTEQSHNRMLNAVDDLWLFTPELFEPTDYEVQALNDGCGADLGTIKKAWSEKVEAVFEEATLDLPLDNKRFESGGKQGKHTEHLEILLAEMQLLQRTYPGCEW